MKVVSWNIAGGRLFKGQRSQALATEYETEDIDYFIRVLNEISPDFIALQEVHSPEKSNRPNQAREIAKKLNLNPGVVFQYSKSHIDQSQKLTLVSLSFLPHKTYAKTLFQLQEKVEIKRPDGQIWKPFRNGVLVSEAKVREKSFTLINLHLTPLHYFDRDFLEDSFKVIRDELEKLFLELASQNPTLIVGDFNFPDINKAFPKISEVYQEAFLGETTPGKGQQDHILFSKGWELKEFEIRKTETDHYPCIVDLEFTQ